MTIAHDDGPSRQSESTTDHLFIYFWNKKGWRAAGGLGGGGGGIGMETSVQLFR